MKIGVLSYADTQYYDGKIDELRLYNRELSANEVKQLYQWAPGPMMHLKMDEKVAGDAQTLYDISGNEMNGTTESRGQWHRDGLYQTREIWSACEFDGVDDRVNLTFFLSKKACYLWIYLAEPSQREMVLADDLGEHCDESDCYLSGQNYIVLLTSLVVHQIISI